MKKLFALFLLINLCLASFGAYLENVPTQLAQPNGEVLNLFITGDEFFRRVHDSEGYSIVPGADGWYYYALYDATKDELVPSEYTVTFSRSFELPMATGLGISREKYMKIREDYYAPTGCDANGISQNSILKNLANAKTTQQINNIVICIGFSDTQEMTNNFTYVDGLFNSNPDNNMRDFFSTMSYNKLDVVSHFYPPEDGTILRFYQAPNPRSYYESVGPSGSDPNRVYEEQTLLKDAVEWVNANYPIPQDINLDIDGDGDCDFISFVIYGGVGDWSWMLWPHKWSLYYYDVYINGKRVWNYNFELDGTPTYFSSNVFCHEGYHVLGAPDLYHYYNYTDRKAVNTWDIMDYSYLTKPQSMSAYMKYKYGNWITNLPTATVNKTYEVFPFYYNDGSDSEKPIMYRIPMTGTSSQYSLVEYRKRAGTNYDAYLPNEGLLIYRINTYMSGNAGFDGYSEFDEVYLYRPGSSQSPGSGVYTNGDLDQAPYNHSNGKTAFNSTTNPKPCQSNGNAENTQNINNILYDNVTDSYTFFYGDPINRNISLDKTELLLEKQSGSEGTVTVTSNVLWRISIPSAAASWLTASKTKELNNGAVIFTTLTENTTGTDRAIDVTFTGNGKTFTVNVIQKSAGDIITVTVSANHVEGGTVTGGGEYNVGDEVTVIATANEGYKFVNWSEDNSIVSTNASYNFTATNNITLVAEFKDENGINDMEKIANFNVYPNPADDVLYIVRSYPCSARIEIFNSVGLLVKSFEINETEKTLDISTLSSGIYIIKLTNNQSFSVQRFVKE